MRALLIILIVVLPSWGTVKAQDCIRANSDGADSLPSFSDQRNSAPTISAESVQVIITSYQFHCCGKIGGWAAYLTSNRRRYSAKFQVWRPTVNNKYVKIGESSFSVLNFVATRRVEEELSNNEQLNFQPGDVVGYYLENNSGQDGGIQFDSSFNIEELWYATGNSALQDECLLEVGSAGDLSMSTNLGPVISISLTATANDNCPSTFTSSLICPTSTLLPFLFTYSSTVHSNSGSVPPTHVTMHRPSMSSSLAAPMSTGLPERTRTSLLTTPTLSSTHIMPRTSQEQHSTTLHGLSISRTSSLSITTSKAFTTGSQTVSSRASLATISRYHSTVTTSVNEQTGSRVNIGLHIGLTVVIGVLLLLVVVTIIVVCVVMKKRGKRPKGGVSMIRKEVSNHSNTGTPSNRYSMQMMDLIIPNRNVAYGRCVVNNRESEMYCYPTNPYIVTDIYDSPTCMVESPSDYYVNEGMGGMAEITMIRNKAYTTAAEVRPSAQVERNGDSKMIQPIIVEENDGLCEPVIVEERDYDSIKLTTDFQLFST